MKKLFKKAIAIILTVVLALSMTTIFASAAPVPVIAVDGKPISIAAVYGTPYIDSANRTQVPIRVVAEALGATVAWEQSTTTAIINKTIKIKLGDYTITTPYGTIAMDTTAIASNGRIYVPVRFLCQALGYDVDVRMPNGEVNANIMTKVELNIAAAASLTNALNELQKAYNASKPNAKLTFNFAASGTLQTQIEQGAPVDIFFSAAAKNMNTLKTKGLLVDSTVKNLLSNDLVLIIPRDSSLTISSFTDVTDASVKSIGIGDPASVPAGTYAQEVFKYYKIWDQVKAKYVLGTPVTQILNWVETGNVDCGVVYSTDATSSAKVRIVATAPAASLSTPIVYPAAVIKSSAHAIAAADFLNFLSSDAAKTVFKKYGFSIL